MYNIKTLNKISDVGISEILDRGYNVEDDMEAPEGILVRSANMHDYEFNPELLAVVRAGAGTNNIPVDRCTEAGIVVFNTPGANAEAVKELAICALIMASRDVIGGVRWVRSLTGKCDDIAAAAENEKSRFAGPEIMGKSLGVVGLGAVGARIANTAVALGMQVFGYDPYLSVDAAWRLSGEARHAVDLDVIYKSCDYITLHVPYMESTHHMINAKSIARMKDGVRIINLARGELVCDDDILAALESGKVARYVTDFPNEKTAASEKVIALPHLGASTPESEEKCAYMAAMEMMEYLENGNIQNSINLPSVVLDRMGVARLCVIHRNVPRMINQFLDLIGSKDINVEHMINKPRGDYAYTIIDLGSRLGDDIINSICSIDEVLRVRVL